MADIEPPSTAASKRLLITGAGGIVGRMLRERMRGPGRVLRLLDVVAVEHLGAGEEALTGSVTDARLMARAMQGVDAVIHLGGISSEAGWEDVLDVNIGGTQTVLSAAQAAGVQRVVLASSNHAIGFRSAVDVPPGGIPADTTARPDTFYGVSKAAMEALGSLYASRFGMDVVAIRIGSCFPDPRHLGARGLATWLSPDDAGRLFEACLAAPSPGFRVVWGVSANTRRVVSLAEAGALGYRPQDDAEVYAAELADRTSPADALVGGSFTTDPLGVAQH